jgi:hypothetical protein
MENGKTIPSSYTHDKTFSLDLPFTSAYSHLASGSIYPDKARSLG